jgi:hypothetical protein
VEEIGRRRSLAAASSGKFIVEHSPVGASQSNGVVERATQAVQGQLRSIKLAFESRCGVKLPSDHPLLAFAVEFASVILNRLEVGHDGKTSDQRLKGKKVAMPGIEFGESVLWKSDNRIGALGKLSSSWKSRIYFGIRSKSGEFVIADSEGIWKARSVRRKPFEERWGIWNLQDVKHFSWKSTESAPVSSEIVRLDPADIIPKAVGAETIPRSMYIRTSDLHEHGFTSGCPGCVPIIRGKP